MPQKHSDGYVRYIIEDIKKWKWLDNEYNGNKEFLNIICNRYHKIQVKFNNINRDCCICKKEDKDELIRLNNYLKAKEITENKGWEMLSEESNYQYYGSKLKIRANCEDKHEFETSYSCLKADVGCPKCKKTKKLTDEEIKINVENRGWKYNFTVRDEEGLKVNCDCDKFHNILVNYDNIKYRKGCPVCTHRIITHEEAEKIINLRNWKMLSEYINDKTKIKCLCDKGHYIEMILRKIGNNTQCPQCINNLGFAKPLEEVLIYIKECDLQLLNPKDYVNKRSELIVKCNKLDHITKTSLSKLMTTENKCKKCSKMEGFSERTIRQHLIDLTNLQWVKNRPDWLNIRNSTNKHFNLEIDCWCDELNTGVEVDGKQHHEFPNKYHKTIEEFNAQQSRDLFKIQKFSELGKNLIRIRALDYYDSIDEMLYYLEQELIRFKIIKEVQSKYGDFLKLKESLRTVKS